MVTISRMESLCEPEHCLTTRAYSGMSASCGTIVVGLNSIRDGHARCTQFACKLCHASLACVASIVRNGAVSSDADLSAQVTPTHLNRLGVLAGWGWCIDRIVIMTLHAMAS